VRYSRLERFHSRSRKKNLIGAQERKRPQNEIAERDRAAKQEIQGKDPLRRAPVCQRDIEADGKKQEQRREKDQDIAQACVPELRELHMWIPPLENRAGI